MASTEGLCREQELQNQPKASARGKKGEIQDTYVCNERKVVRALT